MAKRIISKLTIFLLLNLFVWLMVMPGHASATKKQVLILNSYSQGGPWTDNVMHGMLSVLNNSGMHLEIHVEYMDTKRYPPSESFPYLENMYRQKYRQTAFDVILLSDNNALTFLLSRRDTLFPGVPIVFCGINNFSKELLGGQTDITGITEDIDIKGTIALASRIMPNIQKVVVINDRTPTGQANRKKFEQVASTLPVSFELWDDITATDLQDRLKGLPPDSAVLVFTFHRDKDGQWFSIPEYWTLIRENCRVPIFSLWDNDIGHGVLGGVMVYGKEQGRLCAEYAIRILKGEPANSLPIILDSPNLPVLDYRLLKKFNVPKANIPAEAVVLFEPISLFNKYRNQIIASGILFAVLIVLIIVLWVNILIRRRTERALMKSEALLEATQELAEVGGWEWDVEKGMMFWTKELYRIHGFDLQSIPPGSEEHIKRSLECYDPKDRSVIMAAFERCAKEEHEYDLELPFTRQNGQRLWIRTTARSVMSDGRIIKVIGTIMDITKQKQAAEALQESEKKYRSILENIEDGYYETDLAGNFTFFNNSLCRIFGSSGDELMGMNYRKNTDQEAADRIYKVFNKVYMTGKPIKGLRYVILRKDGSKVYVEVSASLIKNSKGQGIGLRGIIRDVTERQVAEQERIKLEDRFHRAQKMESLGLMAGGIAHDLNNILSGIVSYPELLLMDIPFESPLRKPIETIKESGMRAADVVADLLTIARGVATGKEALNLNTIVTEYLVSAEHLKLEKAHSFIDFRTELDPDLLNMSGSPTHIKKILMNLMTNASEAIEGSGTITISTRNQYLDEPLKGYEDVHIGEYAVLIVSDNGSGISSQDLERIFEPFYTKKVMGRTGTGLGLAVVWNTMQDHDGYINVSTSEKGTAFELYFPVTRKEVAAQETEVPFEDYVGHGEKILVVDDEGRQRVIACGMLTKLGYNAEAVSSGEEAVEYVKVHPVDLVVLDMVMPKGINGRETYEEIIKIRPGQKAIIASGFSETEDVKIAQRLGAGKYIKKPYILEKIGLAVKEELGK